jgi:hypothetical protein
MACDLGPIPITAHLSQTFGSLPDLLLEDEKLFEDYPSGY